MACVTDLCNQGRESCPTPWQCNKYGLADGYLPAMHAPLQSQEPNEAQERKDVALVTYPSLTGPILASGAVGVLAFLALLAWLRLG